MTRADYDMLLEQLSQKMHNPPCGITGKRKEGYDEAILSAKSILSNWYHRYCDKGGPVGEG